MEVKHWRTSMQLQDQLKITKLVAIKIKIKIRARMAQASSKQPTKKMSQKRLHSSRI